MTELKIRTDDWVVICDGRKMLITTNAGDAQDLNLKVLEERERPSPSTHEQGSDRPGRVQQSGGAGGTMAGHGGSRSSVGQTDWHDQAEHAFIKTVAERINHAISAGETKGVVIAAAPRALGVLKPLLSAATVAVLRGSIDRDYVNLPVHEIEKRLKKAG